MGPHLNSTATRALPVQACASIHEGHPDETIDTQQQLREKSLFFCFNLLILKIIWFLMSLS
jgi:hypothetical protein